MQLVGLVLTHSFTNCDFGKIRKKYEKIIYPALEKYMQGTKSTEFNPTISCHNPSECLSTIERDTFTPTPGCASLPTADFARKTWAVFALRCPGYSRVQINSLQEVKKGEDTTNNCLEKASHLLGLWRRFSRISEE
ncbi:thymic stromal lymphopoietin [Oryctolagus cuniculus]|uniref:thymic stromal lymphopoietin n=1 Tax=Oryctolagus cuniculus TaxID=9986 RepID=UPI00387968B2